MKKIGILVGVLVLALALVAGVSADESAANDDTTLIVGFDAEFPPYGYKAENGSYTGFDLELAQEVCKRNNWTFKAQPIDWDAKDSELSSGTIDCIWNGFSITDDRKDKYRSTSSKQIILPILRMKSVSVSFDRTIILLAGIRFLATMFWANSSKCSWLPNVLSFSIKDLYSFKNNCICFSDSLFCPDN